MVCAGQRHPSHQPIDHRPITVKHCCDARLTQIADPFSVKMAKVDAEDWLNDENENALIDMWQTKPVPYDVTGYGVIIIGFLKLKSLSKSICRWIK